MFFQRLTPMYAWKDSLFLLSVVLHVKTFESYHPILNNLFFYKYCRTTDICEDYASGFGFTTYVSWFLICFEFSIPVSHTRFVLPISHSLISIHILQCLSVRSSTLLFFCCSLGLSCWHIFLLYVWVFDTEPGLLQTGSYTPTQINVWKESKCWSTEHKTLVGNVHITPCRVFTAPIWPGRITSAARHNVVCQLSCCFSIFKGFNLHAFH